MNDIRNIICIKDRDIPTSFGFPPGTVDPDLTINKEYQVCGVCIDDIVTKHNITLYLIRNNRNVLDYYDSSLFKELDVFREEQIDMILE